MTETEKLQIALHAISTYNRFPFAHIVNHLAVQNNIQDAIRIIDKIHDLGYTNESKEKEGWEFSRLVILNPKGEKFLRSGGFEMNFIEKTKYWFSQKENNRFIIGLVFSLITAAFLFLNYCSKEDSEKLKLLRDSLRISSSKIVPSIKTGDTKHNNINSKDNVVTKNTANIDTIKR